MLKTSDLRTPTKINWFTDKEETEDKCQQMFEHAFLRCSQHSTLRAYPLYPTRGESYLVNQTVKSVIYSVTSDSVYYIKTMRHILLVNGNSYNDNPTFLSLHHAITPHNVLHIPQDSDDQESTHQKVFLPKTLHRLHPTSLGSACDHNIKYRNRMNLIKKIQVPSLLERSAVISRAQISQGSSTSSQRNLSCMIIELWEKQPRLVGYEKAKDVKHFGGKEAIFKHL